MSGCKCNVRKTQKFTVLNVLISILTLLNLSLIFLQATLSRRKKLMKPRMNPQPKLWRKKIP